MILSCPSCGSRFRAAAQTLGDTGRKVRCAKCKHVWRATAEEAQAEPGEPALDHAIAPGLDSKSGAESSDFGAQAREAMGPPDGIAADSRQDEQGERDGGLPPLAADQQQMEAHRQARREAMRRRAMEEDPPARRGRARGLLGWGIFVLVVGALVAAGWFGRYEIVSRIPSTAPLYAMAGVAIDPVAPGLELRNTERRRQLTDDGNMLIIEGTVVNVAGTTRSVPLLKVVLFDYQGTALTDWTFAAEVSDLDGGEAASFSTQIEDPPETARELSLSFTNGR